MCLNDLLMKLTFSIIFCALLLIITSGNIFAQSSEQNNWTGIETSIRTKKELNKTLDQVTSGKSDARAKGNDIAFARFCYYEMLIRDLRTEDSLYFRNSAFIDSLLLLSKSSKELKTVLHLMQAKRITLFSNLYLKFKRSTYETRDLKYNYGAFTPVEQDSIIRFHYNEAFQISKGLTSNTSADLSWLSSDRNQLPFQTDLGDIAITEKIGFESTKVYGLNLSPEQEQILVRSAPAEFNALVQKHSAQEAGNSRVLDGYYLWTEKHKANPAIEQYIQILLKYYLYTLRPADKVLEQNWKSYLKANLSSSHPIVSASAVYYLFLIHFQEGSKYGANFDDKHKGQLAQAVQLYELHKQNVNQFPGYKKNLEVILQKIKAKEFGFQLQDYQIPQQPILVTANYRNTDRLYYRIIRIGLEEIMPKTTYQRLLLLLSKPALRDSSFTLPNPEGDFDKHAAYLKLEGLPAGSYSIVLSANKISTTDSINEIRDLKFQVSNLTAINSGDRFSILHRKTGLPIKEVKIIMENLINKNAQPNTDPETKKTLKINAQGFVFPGQQLPGEMKIISGGDTLLHQFPKANAYLPREIYDKSSKDLNGFYRDNTSLYIYTDRGIYRPGQKVFYKAILMTRNPTTGEATIFSDVTNPYFKQWLSENKPVLNLRDPNYKIVDSAKITVDDYGSFSGSFVIGKTVMPGRWRIESNAVQAISQNFQVEEYKRPTLEMSMQGPEKTPMPGEPFTLTLTVKSLSGAELNNVRVAYILKRNSALRSRFREVSIKLKDTVGYTDSNGKLKILVQDTAVARSYELEDKALNFGYQLDATATELTGETITLQEHYNVSSWPVDISIPIETYYDRKKLPRLEITATSKINSYKPDQIHLRILKIEQVADTGARKQVDQWLYTEANLKSWFPNLNLHYGLKEAKRLILEKTIPIDSVAHYELDQSMLSSGVYELVGTAKKDKSIIGQTTVRFNVFDSEKRTVPASMEEFSYLPADQIKAGEKLTYYTASVDNAYVIYNLTYYAGTKNGLKTKTIYHTQNQMKGMQPYIFEIPKDAVDNLLLVRAYVLNNKLYKNEQRIYLKPSVKSEPEITIEKYRKVLAPGAKETFSVSVKTANKNTAAQLMTVMYDAALDELATHSWAKPNTEWVRGYLPENWTYSISSAASTSLEQYLEDNSYSRQLQGRVPGLALIDAQPVSFPGVQSNALSEVVTVGYGTRSKTIRIRGTSSPSTQNQPLIVVNGLIYTGSLSDFSPDSIKEMKTLTGPQATALYGAQAANGVVLISTKGEFVLSEAIEQPQVVVRKDFNETAFFYPNIYADENGLYTFTFTMPQTATSWNWKLLAQTQNGLFAYAERQINTRLNLMVQPHMPRLLYQGDKLYLKSRITNSDSVSINVKLSCKIEDAVTGEDLTSKLLKGPQFKMIQQPAGQTGTDGFLLEVPEDLLNPLKIVITATGNGLADAEEHILPVLPKKIFVRQQLPLDFKNETTSVSAPELPADAEIYGVGLHINPKPQAAVINSLPYLINYSYDGTEQIFNKLFAYLTADKLIKTYPELGKSFGKAQNELLADTLKNDALPDELSESAMPWLNLLNRTSKQQKQLYTVLDTLANRTKIEGYLDKIYNMQNADGGLPWFEGGQSNNWVSNYLIRGFGKMKQDNLVLSNPERLDNFLKKLIAYADGQYTNESLDNRMYYAYTRSGLKDSYKIEPSLLKQIRQTLLNAEKSINGNDLYKQALWIISALRYSEPGDNLQIKAKSQLSSIRQLAIKDDRYGLRWKEISDNDNLNHSREETIAMLYEAFSQTGKDKTVTDGLIKWILNTRQEDSWNTTTGTAAAIEMIRNSPELNSPFTADSVSAKIKDKTISVSNDMLNGTNNQFVAASKASAVTVSANKTVQGGLTWYYFSAYPNAGSTVNPVKLDKKLYIFNGKKNAWEPADILKPFKIGEKLKIVLTVETAKPLRFILIEDKRAGVFEPVDGVSGQKYQDGTRFYRSVRDTGQQLFIDFLPSGKSEFSYEVLVTQEGQFNNGPAVLQCLYNPGITAYSNSMMITTENDK